MFVDYITLLLANMIAALVILALYLLCGEPAQGRRHWATAFAAVGLVAFAAGLHMTLTWPVPELQQANLSWANIAYGETSVLLGVLFLAAAGSIAKGWSLAPLAPLAVVASATAVLIGVRIQVLGLTRGPTLAMVGFVLTGAGGLATAAALCGLCGRAARLTAAVLLLGGAGVWAWHAAMGYWGHIARFAGA